MLQGTFLNALTRVRLSADIAQALFVTVKTVEMHLTHVYRKLEIPGRDDLTRALGS